eukprot:172905-Chlamydomonas_euryale.AAC.3
MQAVATTHAGCCRPSIGPAHCSFRLSPSVAATPAPAKGSLSSGLPHPCPPRFPPRCRQDETVVVVMIRNPYDWAMAMHRACWCEPDQSPTSPPLLGPDAPFEGKGAGAHMCGTIVGSLDGVDPTRAPPRRCC